MATTTKKTKALEYYQAVGRRKESVASVRLCIVGKEGSITKQGIKMKKGEIYVGKKLITEVFPNLVDRARYLQPLKMTNCEDRFVVTVNVRGGGKKGQIEAIIHALARALDKVDKAAYHTLLKKQKMFTRDARTRERRKVGTGGKARRAKQSPKR